MADPAVHAKKRLAARDERGISRRAAVVPGRSRDCLVRVHLATGTGACAPPGGAFGAGGAWPAGGACGGAWAAGRTAKDASSIQRRGSHTRIWSHQLPHQGNSVPSRRTGFIPTIDDDRVAFGTSRSQYAPHMVNVSRVRMLLIANAFTSSIPLSVTGRRRPQASVLSTALLASDAVVRGQAPAGQNFPTVGGNLANQRYSSLTRITKANVEPPWRRVDGSPRGRPTGGHDAGDARRRRRRHLHRDRHRQCLRCRWGDRRDQVEVPVRRPSREQSRGRRRRRPGLRRSARQHARRARSEDRRAAVADASWQRPARERRARQRHTTTAWCTSASAAASSACADSSAPTMRRPAKRCGSSGPSRRPANAAARPGKGSRGGTAARRSGPSRDRSGLSIPFTSQSAMPDPDNDGTARAR